MDEWKTAGSPVTKQSALARAIEALQPGEIVTLWSPQDGGYNAPATQAARSGKRLGRTFTWRRSPLDPDAVEVKRTQ